jgi:uncharacterized protein DUF6893
MIVRINLVYVLAGLLALVAAAVAVQLPELKRYLKIESM